MLALTIEWEIICLRLISIDTNFRSQNFLIMAIAKLKGLYFSNVKVNWVGFLWKKNMEKKLVVKITYWFVQWFLNTLAKPVNILHGWVSFFTLNLVITVLFLVLVLPLLECSVGRSPMTILIQWLSFFI